MYDHINIECCDCSTGAVKPKFIVVGIRQDAGWIGFAGVGIAQAALLRQDENARQFYMMLMFCAYAVGIFRADIG